MICSDLNKCKDRKLPDKTNNNTASITRTQLDTKSVMKSPVGLLATWFGSGLAPFAPGTFGTLAALPFAFVIEFYAGTLWLAACAVVISIAGVPISNQYMKKFNREHDPKEVVIDEVAGIWLAIAISNIFYSGIFSPKIFYISYLLSFIIFRFFDIVKPFPISWIDKNVGGGLGVMLDDVIAGMFAAIVVILIPILFSL